MSPHEEGSGVPPGWEGDTNGYCQSQPVGNLAIRVHFGENKPTPTLSWLRWSRAGGRRLPPAADYHAILTPSPGRLVN